MCCPMLPEGGPANSPRQSPASISGKATAGRSFCFSRGMLPLRATAPDDPTTPTTSSVVDELGGRDLGGQPCVDRCSPSRRSWNEDQPCRGAGEGRCSMSSSAGAARRTPVVHGNPNSAVNVRMTAHRVALIDWEVSHVEVPSSRRRSQFNAIARAIPLSPAVNRDRRVPLAVSTGVVHRFLTVYFDLGIQVGINMRES